MWCVLVHMHIFCWRLHLLFNNRCIHARVYLGMQPCMHICMICMYRARIGSSSAARGRRSRCNGCCKTHCNGRMNVAWGLFWGGSPGAKHCAFPCKVVAVGDEGQLVFDAVAAVRFRVRLHMTTCVGMLRVHIACVDLCKHVYTCCFQSGACMHVLQHEVMEADEIR